MNSSELAEFQTYTRRKVGWEVGLGGRVLLETLYINIHLHQHGGKKPDSLHIDVYYHYLEDISSHNNVTDTITDIITYFFDTFDIFMLMNYDWNLDYY